LSAAFSFRPRGNEENLMKNNKHLDTPIQDGQEGVSLVEVVVAVCILIISLTVLLVLFSRTSRTSEAAKQQVNALQVARAELEQLRSIPYLSISSYAARPITSNYLTPFEGKKACTIVPQPSASTNRYSEIAMIISWRGSVNNQIVSQTINTIICNTN
jgi:Tfp pilus assembly protein PilV